MTWSQTIVITTVQFLAAAAVLLCGARVALFWVRQPVARIRLIHFTLAAVCVTALLIALSPWTAWRLGLVTLSEAAKLDDAGQAVANAPVLQGVARTESIPLAERGRIAPLPSAMQLIPRPMADASQADDERPRAVAQAFGVPEAPLVNTPERFNFWTTAALVILGIHVVLVVFLLIEWMVGLVRLRSLKQTAIDADAALAEIWNSITEGCGRNVRLSVSPKIDAPLMFGWLYPVVVVPQELAAVGGRELRFCLTHEWSHIERNDMLSWRSVWACQFLLWCQPLFWKLRRELRVCQDLLADDRSARSGEDAIEYSELLLTLAKRRNAPRFAGALGFLDHSSELTRRIKSLLRREPGLQSHCSRGFSVVAALAALLAALFLGSLRIDSVRAENRDQQPEKSAAMTKADSVPVGQVQRLAAALPAKYGSAVDGSKLVDAKEKRPGANAKPPAAAAAPTALRYECKVVEKETGKGIAGARVVVRRSSLTSQQNRFIQETRHTTDAQGGYSVEIPAEQVADGALYIELDVEHDSYPARKGFGYALSMIRKNEKLGERPFFERVELYPAEHVMGTVLSPAGKPLAGIKVMGFSMADRRNFESSSLVDTLSDAQGRFRLNFHKGVEAVLWVIPREFGIVQKFLDKQRGELGEILLPAGVRVTGKVVGTDDKPLAGVAVNIDASDRNAGNLPVTTSVRRGAVSDAQGRFAFDPLPAGEYRVIPGEYLSDPLTKDTTVYRIPEVFIAKKLTLKEEGEPPSLEVRAYPHVTFHAQILDSSGKKIRGHAIFLFGRLEGDSWNGIGRPNADGVVALQVPRGLQKTQVQLSTNEHGALRYRRGKGQPLQNKEREIEFGTLNDDVRDFEIVRYRAPIIQISAVDEGHQPIKDFRVTAAYPKGQKIYSVKGERSDLNFELQTDGRYRSWQMLPDEETTFTVTAAGYQPASQKLKLAEGEIRELVLTLKKATDEKRAL